MDISIPKEIGPALIVVLTAVMLDTALAIMLHIKKGDLDLRMLPQFLFTGILPYAGGMLVLGAAAQFVGLLYEEIFLTVSVTVVAKYAVDIKQKTRELFNCE